MILNQGQPQLGSGHIVILPPSYESIGQGTWALYYGTSQYLYGEWHNSSKTDGDNITYKVHLDAGTYTLMMVTRHQSTSGILDIDIDGVEVASIDLYAEGLSHDNRDIQTGIVVADTGLKSLQLRIDGKNGGATDYYAFFSYIVLWRTA